MIVDSYRLRVIALKTDRQTNKKLHIFLRKHRGKTKGFLFSKLNKTLYLD